MCTNQEVCLVFFLLHRHSRVTSFYTPEDQFSSRLLPLSLVLKDIRCLLTYYKRQKTTSIIITKTERRIYTYVHRKQEQNKNLKTNYEWRSVCAMQTYEEKKEELVVYLTFVLTVSM